MWLIGLGTRLIPVRDSKKNDTLIAASLSSKPSFAELPANLDLFASDGRVLISLDTNP
jgi:hypothetical protein